ncbi:MAG: hypothetical protein ACLSVD_11835 [Eggerthellaceae bacterium]
MYGPCPTWFLTPIFEMYPLGLTTLCEYWSATGCARASTTWRR